MCGIDEKKLLERQSEVVGKRPQYMSLAASKIMTELYKYKDKIIKKQYGKYIIDYRLWNTVKGWLSDLGFHDEAGIVHRWVMDPALSGSESKEDQKEHKRREFMDWATGEYDKAWRVKGATEGSVRTFVNDKIQPPLNRNGFLEEEREVVEWLTRPQLREAQNGALELIARIILEVLGRAGVGKALSSSLMSGSGKDILKYLFLDFSSMTEVGLETMIEALKKGEDGDFDPSAFVERFYPEGYEILGLPMKTMTEKLLEDEGYRKKLKEELQVKAYNKRLKRDPSFAFKEHMNKTITLGNPYHQMNSDDIRKASRPRLNYARINGLIPDYSLPDMPSANFSGLNFNTVDTLPNYSQPSEDNSNSDNGKSITIYIDKLVENISYTGGTGMEESLADFASKLKQVLINVVNEASIAIE